jgi:hypothetical protein
VFAHRKVLEEAPDREALRFHFGAWGWCVVWIREAGEEG